MTDLDLRQLELEAMDDPTAATRLVALWKRTHGFYRCAGCGEYVPTPHWDDHELACTSARDLVAISTLEQVLSHRGLKPLSWGGNPAVGSVARAQPFYDREFMEPRNVQTSFFVSSTSFSAPVSRYAKFWGSDTNMIGQHMMAGSHVFLLTGISVVPDASASREAVLQLYDHGFVQLRRSQCDVVTVPGRLALSGQPRIELEEDGVQAPLHEAMGKPGPLRFGEAKIVSTTVGGKPVVLDNAFRVDVCLPTQSLPEPVGLMVVLWGIWIAGIPG